MPQQPNTTTARRALTPDEASRMVGEKVPWREPDLTEATVATDADTGEPAFAYLPVGRVGELRRAVLGFDFDRSTQRASGISNTSRTFGYAPKRPVYQREACRNTRLAVEDPDGHEELIQFARRVQQQLADTFPTVAAADVETMRAVDDEWKLGETTWTSGVINQSSSLPYHRDAFNFDVWTSMPVLRRHMRGGYLHIPEYDVTIASRDGWAVFFPGWELVHGVTPMQATRRDGYRYSVVYYALRGMKDCFTHAVEEGQARARRTERERDMAARLKHGTYHQGRRS